MPKSLASSVPYTAQPIVHKRLSRVGWLIVTAFAALLVLIPVLAIITKAFNPTKPIWAHLAKTVLPVYIKETAILTSGVAILTLIIGISTAYVVTRFEFRGRKWFEWLLILPFAMPTYLIAFIYTDLLEYAGPVQGMIRDVMGYQSARDYWFFNIRSMGGGIVTMSLVLYPYVYLLTRTAFLEQSQLFAYSARTLGKTRLQTFFSVVLPMARPSIIVGLMLVLMEVLNDYGAVSYFAIHTFSEGIFDFWLGRNNRGGAAQIASLLLFVVVLLMLIEQYGRRHQTYVQSVKSQKARRRPLAKRRQILAITVCALPVLLGFGFPVMRLLWFIAQDLENAIHITNWQHLWHSLSLSGVAAFLTVGLALFVAYARRMFGNRWVHTLAITSGLGYAIPGAILAIGLMMPLGAIDSGLNTISKHMTGERVGLVFSGTLFAVICAYLIRFMAIAQGTVHAELQKVTPSMDYSAKSLGCSPKQLLTRVHIPIIQKGLFTAFLIVFVDCMKELPATLILRPFNYDTLATHVYQYASDERLRETALPALLIVLTGLLPIILLNKMIRKNKEIS